MTKYNKITRLLLQDVMIARKSISFFIAFLFTLSLTFAQGKEDRNYRLFKIRQIYQQINQYKSYDTVIIDDAEEFLQHNTDNGGSLSGYFKGDSLKKMIEWIGLSNRVIQNEYYFENDKLIFVYATSSNYHVDKKTQTIDYSKTDNIFTGRYYFENGKLVDSILKDKEHDKNKSQDASTFIAAAKVYADKLKAKRL